MKRWAFGLAAVALLVAVMGGEKSAGAAPSVVYQARGGGELQRDLFASRVWALGSAKYPGSVGGIRVSSGQLVVGIVRGSRLARFVAAITAADADHIAYRTEYVRYSYAAQQRVGNWITAHLALLRRQGILPSSWNPDPPADRVAVVLQYPSDQRNLGASAGAEYRQAAANLINREAPLPLIKVEPQFTDPIAGLPGRGAQPSARRPANAEDGPGYDERPFFAGSQIWYTVGNHGDCTANVGVQVTASGKREMLTAAHCSRYQKSFSYYTCATADGSKCGYNVGPVRSLYAHDNDFALIPTSVAPRMWNDTNGNQWAVAGAAAPIAGEQVATDAFATGATFGIPVFAAGGSGSCFRETGAGRTDHVVCNDVILYSAKPICRPGDSGGAMVLKRGVIAYAAGIILASSRHSDGDYYCYGQQIPHILSVARLTLLTAK